MEPEIQLGSWPMKVADLRGERGAVVKLIAETMMPALGWENRQWAYEKGGYRAVFTAERYVTDAPPVPTGPSPAAELPVAEETASDAPGPFPA